MHDEEQRIPRRIATGAQRPFIATWKFIIPMVVLLTAAVLVAVPFFRTQHVEPQALTYTELTASLDAGRVASLEIGEESVAGRWRDAGMRTEADFVTVYPVAQSEALLARAEGAGVAITFVRKADRSVLRTTAGVAIQLVLLGVLAFLVIYHFRNANGGGDFGRKGESNTTFDDVAGTQGAAEDLREMVDFLRDPSSFAAMGARVPKGVLLLGPPGTGKTLLARAVAGEAGVPFFNISGSEVTGFVVGLGAHRLRSLFKKARKRGGVIFIDELDSLGGARGQNRSHNEDDRSLNQLLVEMDGFQPTEGVVVIGATNRPEDLDVALKRPGRFDRQVSVGLPTVDGREAILKLHSTKRNVPVADDVDYRRLARLTPGASGAELANLLNEAAIFAVRRRSSSVAWSDFEAARDRMLLGKERVGFRARDREWKIVAYHEAGHAIAGVAACPEDGLHKVTIQPRGQAMGVAHFAPDDDRHLHARSYLEAQIIKGLGGRVAEEIIFGAEHVTGGAESDLVHVNRVARRMIYRLGMGSNNGLLVYDEAAGPLSGDAQARMDAEVRDLLERLYARTREILTTHRASLDALAQALLERETLDGEEAMQLLSLHGLDAAVTA